MRVAFGMRSVVVRGTMSGVVKQADIGLLTAECQLMVWPSRRRLVTWGGELWPVQGGAEGTEERVLVLHTEEERHDVERVTALRVKFGVRSVAHETVKKCGWRLACGAFFL